jgi:large subunit ribosomal protein L9
MKIILMQTVPKVGKEGTVVNVADGFARNYLFPRKLAIVADKNQIAALERKNARQAAKSAEGKATAEALRDRINGKSIRIPGNVGAARGKMFGAITAQAIADAIKGQLGETIERRHIALIDPIKRLGTIEIGLDLHRDVDATVSLEVFDPNAPVEAAPAAQSEAEPEPAAV